MVDEYFIIAVLFSTACLFQVSMTAIAPLDKTYTATADTDFRIPWKYDNETDMSKVFWTYKSSASATTTTIMSKDGAAAANVFNNYNVEHFTSGENGEIKLKAVKINNTGIYFCQVSYTLSSGLTTVTGTATLSVSIATATSTTPTTTNTTTTSTTPTTTSTMPSTTGTPTSITSTMPTTISTKLPTTSTMPATTISTTATSTTTLDNSFHGELAVIIISSVVGGLLVVGIAIAALFFFHRQRNKKNTTRNQSHLGRDHHKQYKTSKSPYQQKNDHYLYNGRTHDGGRQVKEKPLNGVSKERSLSRSYYTGASSRYDNYRPTYTMEYVYPLDTSGHRFMSEYIGGNRNPKNMTHSSYPGYSMRNMRYTDNKIFYY